MEPIFQVTLKAKPTTVTPAVEIVIRVKGLPRNEAILLAEKIAGEGYEVYYVIAGPRNEVV